MRMTRAPAATRDQTCSVLVIDMHTQIANRVLILMMTHTLTKQQTVVWLSALLWTIETNVDYQRRLYATDLPYDSLSDDTYRVVLRG